MELAVTFKVIGWLGQAFFFFRFLVQWLASEKAKAVVVPRIFWWLSLAGSVCGFSYALYERNLIFLSAPTINFFIYSRNLVLSGQGKPLRGGSLWAMVFGLATLLVVSFAAKLKFDEPLTWILIGGIGQLCWVIRFPVQWWISEKSGHSHMPKLFFQISLFGSLLLLSYAIHTGNPIWILGMMLTPFLCTRNLMLAYRSEKTA